MEKRILFSEFFNVPDPEHTKVKFNMNAGDRGKPAWDNLKKNSDDARFDDWIEMNAYKTKQSNNNLGNAKYLLSFAQYYPLGPDYYVFGGYYKVEKRNPEVYNGTGYNLSLQEQFAEYRKRLIIKLGKPIGRDLYNRLYNNVQSSLDPEVYEISPSTKLGAFPGYFDFHISHSDMQDIFNEEAMDWKKALSYVKGVYCITDTSTGKLYIGSAYGENGIWGRWKSYADVNDLTGGNKAFEEMKKSGADYIIKNFQYSVLEIFDMRTPDGVIINREKYWKEVFASKDHGMNHN